MLIEYLVVLLLVTSTAAYAAVRGGHPEKLCAAIIVGGIIIDLIILIVWGVRDFKGFEPSRMFVDVTLAVLFLSIALRANRIYPLLLSSSQIIAVIGNLAAYFIPDGMTRAYWAMTQLPLFFQLALLAGGTHAHRLRVAKIGNYNSWSPIQTRRGNPA